MRTIKLLPIWLALLLAIPALAAAPAVLPGAGSNSVRLLQVTMEPGDSGESEAIDNRCASWQVSFVNGTGGQFRIYAVPTKTTAVASGYLLTQLNDTSATPISFKTALPYIKFEVFNDPTGNTATAYLYCSLEGAGGGGGGWQSLAAGLTPVGSGGTKNWGTILASLSDLVGVQTWDASAQGKGEDTYYSAEQTNHAGATCGAGNVNTIYAITDSDGFCGSGGSDFQACRCQAAGALRPVSREDAYGGSGSGTDNELFGSLGYTAGASPNFAGRGAMEVWARQTTGATAPPAAMRVRDPFPGNNDWPGNWDIYGFTPYYVTGDSCIQEKRITGSPVRSLQGTTAALYMHLAAAQQSLSGLEGSSFFVGWQGAQETGVILNNSGATPALVMQNFTDGVGVLWHNNQFHQVWVRNGSFNTTVLLDLSDATARSNWWTANRQLHAILYADVISPSNGDASVKYASHYSGFYPAGATSVWTSAAAPANGYPRGSVKMQPIRAICRDASKPAVGFGQWVVLAVSRQVWRQWLVGF